MRPTTYTDFLPFGDPQGIRVAEITTRTVQVFDVPRSEIAAFFDMPESGQVAVYYLFGDEIEDGRTQCYIGQTEASRIRFKEHLKKSLLVPRTHSCFKNQFYNIYPCWLSRMEIHSRSKSSWSLCHRKWQRRLPPPYPSISSG